MEKKWFMLLGLVSIVIGLINAEPFLDLIKIQLPKGIIYIATQPSDGFLLLIYSALSITITIFSIGAMIILWKEYKTALYKKEKELIKRTITPSIILFLAGMLFGIISYIKIIIPFFIELNTKLGLQNYWNLTQVIIDTISTGLLIGIAFQLPIIIKLIIEMGITKKEELKKKRPIAIFLILLISAIMTPSPDILSQLIVAIPLYVLFEVSLL